MKTLSLRDSACHNCRYYKPEGRRGGFCELLQVSVQGKWACCPLAAHPFNNALTNLEKIVKLENSLSLDSQINTSSLGSNSDRETLTPELV